MERNLVELPSRLKPTWAISKRRISLLRLSNSSGEESISIRKLEQASSIKSTDLSGRKRSAI